MIGYLEGKVLGYTLKKPLKVVAVVLPKQSGVGYNVVFSPFFARRLGRPPVEVKLWIYHYFAQNEQVLLGLDSLEKLQIFYEIVGIAGVGPQIALNMVDYFDSVESLKQAVEQRDVSAVAEIPGIGKKRAARIIVALSGKLVSEEHDFRQKTEYNLLKQALRKLGFSATEADSMIKLKASELKKAISEGKPIDELIKLVLAAK